MLSILAYITMIAMNREIKNFPTGVPYKVVLCGHDGAEENSNDWVCEFVKEAACRKICIPIDMELITPFVMSYLRKMMVKNMKIERYTKARIPDVITFEKNLRSEENDWGWEINEEYVRAVEKSFENPSFENSISLLAYVEGKVVGRIDSTMVCSHFDGSVKAYLDWICVIKSYRHKGVAQALMAELQKELKQRGVVTLIGLIDSGEGAQRFYRSMENAIIHDEGIWIDIK